MAVRANLDPLAFTVQPDGRPRVAAEVPDRESLIACHTEREARIALLTRYGIADDGMCVGQWSGFRFEDRS